MILFLAVTQNTTLKTNHIFKLSDIIAVYVIGKRQNIRILPICKHENSFIMRNIPRIYVNKNNMGKSVTLPCNN